jgi:hypothetical protein
MKLRKTVFIGMTTAAVFFAGCAVGAQVHMRNALDLLQDAKIQLEQADTDKGGYRVRAIQLINQTITEVKAGIEYSNNH